MKGGISMLNENLKTLRREKGFSQEELAIRLNVVRQTISKWEKGLSVPDADMLVRISEIFEVPVQVLLGGRVEAEAPQQSELVEQLSRINEQLAIKNRRARKIWRTVAGILITLFAAIVLTIVLTIVLSYSMSVNRGITENTTQELLIEEHTEIIEK